MKTILADDNPACLLPVRRFTFVLFGFANAFFVLFTLSGQEVQYTRILQVINIHITEKKN